MANQNALEPVLFVPGEFTLHGVRHGTAAAAPAAAPPLGPLAAFVGNFTGQGFNTIFRPDNPVTPTAFTPPIASDNVLELNLTQETLSFSKPLGSVPNRGSNAQGNIFLNGVPYLQTINDVTTLPATGIHFEPGIWLNIPATTQPAEPVTLARMASIPHGTTIEAQGTLVATVKGGPVLNPVSITPFVIGDPTKLVTFPSQTASDATTPRIPQDLSPFIAEGTITQAMLTDPNTVLRNQVANQTITQTEVIFISTNPAAPLPGGPLPAAPLTPNFGGGTDNVAFLLGDQSSGTPGPNAQSFQMDAIFWIETVEYEVLVPPLHPGAHPVILEPVQPSVPVPLVPRFSASIPAHHKPFPGRAVTISTTQIQYSQKVLLNFHGLSWPHASVASLVPADPIVIPVDLL
jgi:hypothetical protein